MFNFLKRINIVLLPWVGIESDTGVRKRVEDILKKYMEGA